MVGDVVMRGESGRPTQAGQGARPVERFGELHHLADRFVPADERPDSLWIVGAATVLAGIKAVVYRPLQSYVAAHVYSPRLEELGFALRATAIADLAWGVLAGIFILLLLRYTKAPKATALYIVFVGLSLVLIGLGNQLALSAALTLSGSLFQPSLWSDLQPLMLAAAAAVGVTIGAWVAQLRSREERPSDGSTLLPAVGWTGRPLTGAARLAMAYVGVRGVGLLAATMVLFVPQACAIFVSVSQQMNGFVWWSSLIAQVVVVAIYASVGYFGIKRYRLPVTIWLAFFAAGLPAIVTALAFLPGQYALVASSAGWSSWAAAFGFFAFVAWPFGALPPIFGVWLATRPERVSEPSDTLPAEDNDHS